MTRAEKLQRIAELLDEVDCLQQEVVEGERCREIHYAIQDLVEEFEEMVVDL